mmetsp:Transcript_23039/g.35626  ORF Transcript_23039/g.35626 Transcript_23039/m.35626 type:complete len:258 (+) Transcript_23039:958-1731(+)
MDADERHQDGPSNTSEEAEHVRVDASLLCPELDAAESNLELAQLVLRVEVRQDGVSHSSAVERLDSLRIAVSQDLVVIDLQVVEHVLLVYASKEQIDINMIVNHLDNGDERVFDHHQLVYSLFAFEDLRKEIEEVVIAVVHMGWNHAHRIDVSAGSMDAKAVRPEFKNLAPRISDDIRVSASILSTLSNPLLNDVGQFVGDFLPDVLLALILKLLVVLSQDSLDLASLLLIVEARALVELRDPLLGLLLLFFGVHFI